jgi:transcriptional regulator with XRE-family HTH domain
MLMVGIMGNGFPIVKCGTAQRAGSALPAMGNTLHAMPKNHKKLRAAGILAENLKTLMAADADLSTGPKVAKASGVSRKSINNIAENRHDPKLSSIEAIAKAYRLDAYQMLAPGIDNNLLAIFRAYRETSESGRELLTQAAEVALKRRDRKTGTGPDE